MHSSRLGQLLLARRLVRHNWGCASCVGLRLSATEEIRRTDSHGAALFGGSRLKHARGLAEPMSSYSDSSSCRLIRSSTAV